VVERASGAVHHAHVRDLPQWLRASDTLVVNRTRVAHARLMLRREADGRELEGLLAAPLPGGAWLLLAKGGKRLREGDRLQAAGNASRRVHGDHEASNGFQLILGPLVTRGSSWFYLTGVSFMEAMHSRHDRLAIGRCMLLAKG
jgi:S-adenosylmethionine:tRNA-ribosyltransferase-isomerase (queuine synthetase)